jgi:hypothetical protein
MNTITNTPVQAMNQIAQHLADLRSRWSDEQGMEPITAYYDSIKAKVVELIPGTVNIKAKKWSAEFELGGVVFNVALKRNRAYFTRT